MAGTFVDRKANRPNRYKVIPDSGGEYYVTLERADEPTELGTPLTAANLNKLYGEDNKPTAAAIGAIPADNNRTDIPSGADLNSTEYLRVGAWRATTTAIASSLVNSPVTMAFILDVISGNGRYNQATETSGYILQRITTQMGDQYFRRVYAAADGLTFNAWGTMIHSGNVNQFITALAAASVE